MSATAPYLGKNRVLAALPDRDFEQFFPALETVDLPLRYTLQEAGSRIERVFFVEQGVASVLATMSSGSTVEVGMIGVEGIVGVAGLFGARTSPHRIIVQISGIALALPLSACRKAFAASTAFETVALDFANDLFNLSAQTAACNRLHSIEQRCARWLLMAHDRTRRKTMSMTHEFLAATLGVRRAGVTVAAGELQRSGLIKYRSGEVVIRDHAGLVAAACECYQLDHERLDRWLTNAKI